MAELCETGSSLQLKAVIPFNRARAAQDWVHRLNHLYESLLVFTSAYRQGDDAARERQSYCDCLSQFPDDRAVEDLVGHTDMIRFIGFEPFIRNPNPLDGRKPDSDHRDLRDAFVRFREVPCARRGRRVLVKLGQLLHGTRGTYKDTHRFLNDSLPARGKDLAVLKVTVAAMEAVMEAMMSFPERVLASYGSLRPAEQNHALVSNIPGNWTEGTINGSVMMADGYPVFLPSGCKADPIAVQILQSYKLPDHWERLDKFEGQNYRRIVWPIETAGGVLMGNVYAHRDYCE